MWLLWVFSIFEWVFSSSNVYGHCWPRERCTAWAYSPPRTNYVKVPIFTKISSGCSSGCQGEDDIGDFGGCGSSCDIRPVRTIERYIVRMRPRIEPPPVTKEFIIQEPIIQQPEPRPVVIRQPVVIHEPDEQAPNFPIYSQPASFVQTIQQQPQNYEMAPPVVRTVEEVKYENVGQVIPQQIVTQQVVPSSSGFLVGGGNVVPAGYSANVPAGFSMSAPSAGSSSYQQVQQVVSPNLSNSGYDPFLKMIKARAMRRE